MIIRITAKTQRGTEALMKHYEEVLKLNRPQKIMQKAIGIIHTIENTDPLTIEIEIRNKRLSSIIKPEHIIREVKDTLFDNGAEEKDYLVEVL